MVFCCNASCRQQDACYCRDYADTFLGGQVKGGVGLVLGISVTVGEKEAAITG